MAEGRVTEVVRETDGFGQFFVEFQGSRGGARDLRNLERMRQPRAIQVTFMIYKYLRLVHQAAKRRGMNDAVAIALILRSVRRLRFRMAAASRVLSVGGVGSEGVHAAPLFI